MDKTGQIVLLCKLFNCNFNENGSEFQRDASESIRLDLNKSILVGGIFVLI